MTRYWIPAENNAVEWTTCVHENAIPISPSTPREPCRLVDLDLDGVYGDNGGMVWFGGCVVDWLPWKQGRDSGDRGHKVKDDEDGHLIYQEGDLLQARCTCHFVMFSLGLFFPWDQNFVPCFFALSFFVPFSHYTDSHQFFFVLYIKGMEHVFYRWNNAPLYTCSVI